MKVLVFDHMEECTEAEVQRMLPLVSAQRREQTLRYKHLFGRYCCLKSWMMLDGLTGGHRQEWRYNEHGKPCMDGLHFNISHCKAGIAVVVDEQPVGIDIESVRHADNDLIVRTMNVEEQKQIHSDRDFTRLWTQKEAIAKALGTGIESFEQLQGIRSTDSGFRLHTVETGKYIYSIAYKN